MTIPGVAALVSVAVLLACDGRGPRPELTTYRLSGSVYEMTPAGSVPVDGALIEETFTHQHTTTDGGGFYSLYGLYARTSTFRTSKPGYNTEKRNVTITGDVRISIRLKRISTGDSSFGGGIALPIQGAKQP